MSSARTVRNVCILLVIAAAVAFLPGGGRLASTFTAALWAAFGLGMGLIGLRTYRERRTWIYSLGDAHRAMLYGAIAIAAFAWAARARMWHTGVGELLWFVLVAVAAYFAMEVYRRSRAW